MLDFSKIIDFAAEKHQGQKRWNGDRYITHPVRVSKSKWIETDLQRAAAIMHDCVEDCDCTAEEIAQKFGPEISEVVALLTHDKNEKSYAEYIMSIRENEDASRVKLADLEDNLSDIRKGSMKDKYQLAHAILKESL